MHNFQNRTETEYLMQSLERNCRQKSQRRMKKTTGLWKSKTNNNEQLYIRLELAEDLC